MPSWLVLTAAALLLALGVAVLLRGLDQARLVGNLARLEPGRVAEAGPGLRLVQGTIAGGPLLLSPYQRRPCVYYFFRVSEPRESGPPRTLATGKEWTTAHVADASGRARVEAWQAVVASPRRFEERLDHLAAIPPERAEFFERAGIDPKHLPQLPSLVVHEYTLEPGDDVYVTGTVRTDAEGKVFYRAKRRPLIVSVERDIGYLQGLRNELLLYVALAPLLLAAGGILALLGLA